MIATQRIAGVVVSAGNRFDIKCDRQNLVATNLMAPAREPEGRSNLKGESKSL
jgi:hypothetical protein